MTTTPAPPPDLRRSGTSVGPVALTQQAARVAAAAAALEPGALAAAACRIAVATPGSRSAPAAAALARRWESAVRAWAADAADHGAALARSAGDYAATDRDAATALRAVP